MGFLIVFPLIVAAALLFVRQEGPRRVIVCVSGVAIALASVVLVVMNLGASCTLFAFESMAIDFICTGISVAIAAVIVWFAVRYKNLWAAVLAGVQVVGTLILEFMFSHGIEVPYGLYFDSLSLLMTFIIGVVGSGICIYALGYMEDFQAHEPEGAPDRRPMFFALMFVFLSAMYVIVFSNNMEWMFTGWEVTTLLSFLIIGYTRTVEAVANAFRQIIMNLAGGIGFLVALWCCALTVGTFSFYEFLVIGQNNPALTTLAVTALAFAGITKAAQMPFQTWLLGAMVAPTPTSALLHSSTMVKAGVFLLVKLAPVLHVSPAPAVMVMLVGGITFVLCSFMAISQSNAKRVLAYSTIANLGLITACAGVGTAEAVWAACFLILFHAIAKSLLFLCVGTAEHHIGSRDIESMDALVSRMPRLACLMALGICGMFVAPFGMLVSKWAALGAFVDSGLLVLVVMMGFGSAATFFFWAKWLGKILCNVRGAESVEEGVHSAEWVALGIMAAATALLAVFLPFVSEGVVAPYVARLVGGSLVSPAAGDLAVMAIMALVMLVVPVSVVLKVKSDHAEDRGAHQVNLGGVALSETTFSGALGGEVAYTQRNWYLDRVFNEEKISRWGGVVCILVALAGIACALGMSYLSFFVGSVI